MSTHPFKNINTSTTALNAGRPEKHIVLRSIDPKFESIHKYFKLIG